MTDAEKVGGDDDSPSDPATPAARRPAEVPGDEPEPRPGKEPEGPPPDGPAREDEAPPPDGPGRDPERDEPPPDGPVPEDEPAPGSPAETGEPMDVTWHQPQGRYPAQERPRDRADTPRENTMESPMKDRPDEAPEESTPTPDATTGEEGGGTDAEFRDDDDRERGRPPKKSPARERKRVG